MIVPDVAAFKRAASRAAADLVGSHAAPDHVFAVAALPKTITGKTARKTLQLLLARLDAAPDASLRDKASSPSRGGGSAMAPGRGDGVARLGPRVVLAPVPLLGPRRPGARHRPRRGLAVRAREGGGRGSARGRVVHARRARRGRGGAGGEAAADDAGDGRRRGHAPRERRRRAPGAGRGVGGDGGGGGGGGGPAGSPGGFAVGRRGGHRRFARGHRRHGRGGPTRAAGPRGARGRCSAAAGDARPDKDERAGAAKTGKNDVVSGVVSEEATKAQHYRRCRR